MFCAVVCGGGRWPCQAIFQNCEELQQTPPGDVRAHLACGITLSATLFRGMAMTDICAAAAAALTSSRTFAQAYLRDMTADSVAHTLLGTGTDTETVKRGVQ